MKPDEEAYDLVWAFIRECLEGGGFSVKKRHCSTWEWVFKEGSLDPGMIWVGLGAGDSFGPPRNVKLNVEVGRKMRDEFPEDFEDLDKVFGVLSIADPEFTGKLLALVEFGVKLIVEKPRLFEDKNRIDSYADAHGE